MEDFDFLGDGTGSQTAPKSKFERDLEKFGDISTLKDAKKAEEDRLRQAGKSYDISEKDDPNAGPLDKPDFLKQQGNIDRDALILNAAAASMSDEAEAEAYAAKYAAQLLSAAEKEEQGKAEKPIPQVTYAAPAVKTADDDDDNIVVVKNDDADVPEKSAPQRVVVPPQDNGLPVLAELSDVWIEEAAKTMGYTDVVLSEREKDQIRKKEDSKVATFLEKSLREKTRVSTAVFTEKKLRTAKTGRILVFVCAAVCLILGAFCFITLRASNEVVAYAGAVLAVAAVLSLIKVRLFARIMKFALLLSVFAFAAAGLFTEMYQGIELYNAVVYIVGVVLSLAVLGILAFSQPVSAYYMTDMKKEELQL
jgi:hypothetical protein